MATFCHHSSVNGGIFSVYVTKYYEEEEEEEKKVQQRFACINYGEEAGGGGGWWELGGGGKCYEKQMGTKKIRKKRQKSGTQARKSFLHLVAVDNLY